MTLVVRPYRSVALLPGVRLDKEDGAGGGVEVGSADGVNEIVSI